MDLNLNFNFKGSYEIKVIDANGNVKTHFEVPNMITNVGISGVADLIGGVNGISDFEYIAIGSGTTGETQSDTTLEYEITSPSSAARQQASKSLVTTSVDYDTLQLQATFSFDSDMKITEAGVFNASSGGTMLSRKTFNEVNVSNGDSLQITYKIQVGSS